MPGCGMAALVLFMIPETIGAHLDRDRGAFPHGGADRSHLRCTHESRTYAGMLRASIEKRCNEALLACDHEVEFARNKCPSFSFTLCDSSTLRSAYLF